MRVGFLVEITIGSAGGQVSEQQNLCVLSLLHLLHRWHDCAGVNLTPSRCLCYCCCFMLFDSSFLVVVVVVRKAICHFAV